MALGGVTTDYKYKYMIAEVQSAVGLPVLVGSGVSEDNLLQYLRTNAMIIGSHVKMHGLWYKALDPTRVDHFMSKVRKLREEMEGDENFDDPQPPENRFSNINAQGE